MPQVHVERVSVTRQMYRLINLIGHTWHPYFSEHTGMTECIRVSLKLQSKSQSKYSFNQCNSEERGEWKKFATSDQDSGITGLKAEGYQARP